MINVDSFGSVGMDGGTFRLASNGIVTELNNGFTYDQFYAFSCRDTSNNFPVMLSPGVFQMLTNIAGGTRFRVQASASGNTELRMFNSSAELTLIINTQTGIDLRAGRTLTIRDSFNTSRLIIDGNGYIDFRQPFSAGTAATFVEFIWILVNGSFRKIPTYA